MERKNLAWLAIVITTVFWSSSLILAKIVYYEVTPIIFVALRYTIACPFLVLIVALTRKHTQSSGSVRRVWYLILAAGITGPFLSQMLQYIGLSLTTAGETLLLLNLSPVFAVIMAAPVLKESITSTKVGGLALAMLGVVLIMLGGTSIDAEFNPLRLLGDIIIIVSTFLFAINGIVGKIAVESVDSASLTLYSTLSIIPFLWLTAATTEDITIIPQLSLASWMIILWVAVVNTAIAFMLYYESMKHIEASKVQIALNLIAVWGVIMSVIVLGEVISPLQILGGISTIIGVVISQRSKT
ncbi:MAG: DMT family transporter [Candidatus Thorarchaeota archaeon]|jgi:drug/metabolite transporter (DMT)-like permease